MNMKYLHTVKLLGGSMLASANGLTVGMLAGVLLTAAVGPATGANVTNPGSGFVAVPTLVAAGGSSGVFLANMQAQTISVAAPGTGYAPGDQITTTGGTADHQAIAQVLKTKLISAAINAAGSGYATGDVITLNGGSFTTQAKATVATTKLVSVALNAAGTGYVPTDTVTLAGGTAGTKAIVTITNIKLVSAALNAAGTGYAIGDTVTLAGGTSSAKAVITVDTLGASGAIATFHISTAGVYTVGSTTFTQFATSGAGSGATFNTGVFGINVFAITTAGSYTVNSATFTQNATSGAGTGATFQSGLFGVLTNTITTAGSYSANSATFTQASATGSGTGATFNTAVWGVGSVSILNPGLYSVLASNPLSQGSTSGAGTGATLNLDTYGVGTITVDTAGTGYANGAAITIAGDLTGFAGAVSTLTVGSSVEIQVTGLTGLPSNYVVAATPDGPAVCSISNKTKSGFTCRLDPVNINLAIGANAVDFLVVG